MNTRAGRRFAVATLTVAVALAGAACGGRADVDDEAGGGGSASEGATSDGASPDATEDTGTEVPDDALVIDVTIEGDTVTPNAERVEAAVGQPVVFQVTSDTTSELHGHASPEFEFEIEPGTSTHTVTFDEPASVTVELHDPDRTLVQLIVR